MLVGILFFSYGFRNRLMSVDISPCSPSLAMGDSAQGCSGLPPVGTRPARMVTGYTVAIVGIHLLSLLVFVPWLFSWTGVLLFIAGHYVFGMLGMTVCYHRLLTHRGFSCPKWLEHFLAILGVCCLQDSPARWVAVHRKHHQHSDEQPDPHSPLVAFLWGHLGWLLVENRDLCKASFYEHYARDILHDPFYMRLERKLMWLWVYVAHAALFFVAGLAIGWVTTGRYLGGVQFGASLLVWGVFARTVFVWHVTWSVNSLTHLWGYRTYLTDDNSRNNWLVGLLAHGEGWHNNHHADQASSAHGHQWWELDITYLTICLLEAVGLASNVVRPRLDR
jgi:stearoyl-CoA desaturase (delta-9 desaturase)